MFGLPPVPWGPLGIAGGTDTRPTNTEADTNALTKLYNEVSARNRTPQGRISRGFEQFGPQASRPQAPMLPTPPSPAPVDMGQFKPPVVAADEPPAQAPGPLSSTWAGPHSVGGAELPTAGPTSVGGAPLTEGPPAPTDMGFFARNSAMMTDPLTGSFLDPTAASTAQASGPDVINKLMSYFHQKGTPT